MAGYYDFLRMILGWKSGTTAVIVDGSLTVDRVRTGGIAVGRVKIGTLSVSSVEVDEGGLTVERVVFDDRRRQ